jgi:hypothetical protein
MIDLSNYTIDQLTQLQSKVNNLISEYSDGHIYICKIKSYGRNSTNKNIRNTKTLQDLCYEYNGDNGIVDVFTTNKDLGEDFSNYGDTMFIKSIEDYQKWSKYKSLSNEIEMAEQHLIVYEEDQKKSFYDQQFRFGPYYTGEVIDQMKEELKNLPTDFEEPTLHRRESR